MGWNSEVLEKKLSGKFIGLPLYYYPEIGSTNDEAFRLGNSGAPEGAAVIADSQTKGKGRLQRVWHSPSGSNIYTSILLRPKFGPERAPQISIAAGVAVAETLSDYCPDQIQLKWPNDVLLNNKKVCGILSQIKTSANGIGFVILGIGINVNILYDQLPSDIRNIATSMAIETGREIDRVELIIGLYENMAKWYKQLTQEGFGAVKEKWLNLAPMIGRKVQVMFHQEVISGEALGLDEDGSLIILTVNNEKVKVSAGDATILKES
jgi:BirA family transcriptional regulator, biotin operon repressor / biotin---[acetyl-CoA-carboxylase] ligase